MEKLASFFDGKPVHRVLDIGTGSGDFIQLISNVFSPEVQITGVDPSPDALAEARKGNYQSKVNFLQMEGENLLFENETFDVVCLSNAMHHLANPGKTFSEMKRVVKPGGWLLIAEIVSDGLNEAQENQKMLHHFKSYVDRKSGITHRETWTEAEVLEIVKANQIQPVLIFPYNRMTDPEVAPEKLEARKQTFAGHLKAIEGQPEYEEKLKLFEIFQERLAKYGFQQARQIVVVATKNQVRPSGR